MIFIEQNHFDNFDLNNINTFTESSGRKEPEDFKNLDEDTGKMLVVKTILRDIGSVDSEKSIANGGEGGEGTGHVREKTEDLT